MFDDDPWKGSTDISPTVPHANEREQNEAFLSSSNSMESVPSVMLKRIQNCDTDLPTLLASLGLEKYIRKFFLVLMPLEACGQEKKNIFWCDMFSLVTGISKDRDKCGLGAKVDIFVKAETLFKNQRYS